MNLNMDVLLVDDSETILFRLCSLLSENGCRVQTTNDGNQAIARLKAFQPNLIISDFTMPGMDGFSMLRVLQGDPNTSDIPVFVLTGKSMNAGTRQMIEFEPNVKKIFNKPPNDSALLEAVKKLAQDTGKYSPTPQEKPET